MSDYLDCDRDELINICNNEGYSDLTEYLGTVFKLKEEDFPEELADEVAEAILDAYGPIVVNGWRCFAGGKFETIMDDDCWDDDCDPVLEWLFRRAFERAGFKRASECTYEELRDVYVRTGYYAYTSSRPYHTGMCRMLKRYDDNDDYGHDFDDEWGDDFGIIYDYAQIKKDKHDLNQELIEKVYSPDRIRKWVEAGNELENYLN